MHTALSRNDEMQKRSAAGALVAESSAAFGHEALRGVVHELRNIGFALVVTVENGRDEDARPPTQETFAQLRGIASRVTSIANALSELTESLEPVAEIIELQSVIEAAHERFPVTPMSIRGPKGMKARGDAGLLLRALAHVVAVFHEHPVTITVGAESGMLHIIVASARKVALARSIDLQIAQRFVRAQGGTLRERDLGEHASAIVIELVQETS